MMRCRGTERTCTNANDQSALFALHVGRWRHGSARARASEFASTPNVVVARSAPHQIILEQAAAIITHRGHGTAMKALHAGVPAVCIPMGRDQNDTAARIVARGAGIRLKTKSSSARIAEAVTSVLNDPKYREGARALASRIRAELAAKDPADALLEGLRSGRDTIRELTP